MFLDFGVDATGDLIHQAASMQWMSGGRLKMPLVLRGCIGVLGSAAAHHSGNFYPIFMHIPGFRVVVPTTPRDAKGLIKTAIRSDDPVLFLEHRGVLNTKGLVPEEECLIPFGKAAIAREGKDVTIVAIAFMVNRALEACEQLTEEGVSAEVIDPRTLAPLDIDTIVKSVQKTSRLVVAHEAAERGGFAAEVIAQIADKAFGYIDAPIQRVCAPSVPPPFARNMEDFIMVDEFKIADRVRKLVHGEI